MTDQTPTPNPDFPPPQPYADRFYREPARKTSGLAVASLVLGILWVLWVGSILAVVFGHIALKQTREPGTDGRGLAIAGLVLGYIGVGTLLFWFVLGAAAAGAGA